MTDTIATRVAEPVKTTVESFTATDGANHTVVVRQDNDLDVKFRRGEVAPNDQGRLRVAMVLGVDDGPIDLVLFHGEDVRETLLEIREAVEVALTGLLGHAPK